MKRKQLKALPLPSNLKSTKHVGGKEFGSCSYYHNALYAARVDSSTGESILIIDLFNHKSGEFQRRFFFSEDNWFSIDNERTESARQLMGEWYYYFYDYKPITKYDALTVKEFFIENEYIKRINQALGYPLINENTVCVGFGFEDGTEEQIVLRPDLMAGEVSQ